MSRADTARADGLLVREGRIARLGGYDALKRAYPEAETLDWSALYVLPALVNTHVHLEFDATAQARVHYIDETPALRALGAAKRANEALKSGVATLRDAGSDWTLLDLKTPRAGELCALPRMQMAGPPLTVTGGHLHFLGEETDGVTDMVRQTRLRQKRGCDAVKLIVTGGQMTPGSVAERVSMTTEEIRAVVDEAHLLNVPTFAHCLTTEGFARCMDGGVDCIEHIACFIRNRENGLLERVYEPEVHGAIRGAEALFHDGAFRRISQSGRLPKWKTPVRRERNLLAGTGRADVCHFQKGDRAGASARLRHGRRNGRHAF